MRVLKSALIVITASAATALLAIAAKAALEAVYGANPVDEFFIAGPSVVIVVIATVFLASMPLKKRLGGRKTPPGYRLKYHQLIIPMVLAAIVYGPAMLLIRDNFSVDDHWWKTLLQYSLFTAGMTAGFCWWLADIEKAATDGMVSKDPGDGGG